MEDLFCIIEKKEEILEIINRLFDFVCLNCLCCNICFNCKVMLYLRKESNRVGINTFNSDVDYWSIEFEKNKDNEYMPKLTYYLLEK